MAEQVTKELEGSGLWGVEFFIAHDGVYFSELSPRPHDTGMCTLSGSQNFSEFELHARTVLGYPIPEITQEKAGVSAVILATSENSEAPIFSGVAKILENKNTDIRLFGKPTSRPYRRMGVVLLNGEIDADMRQMRENAAELARQIKVN